MSNIDKKLKDARKIPLVLKLAPISKSSEFSAKNFVSFTKISINFFIPNYLFYNRK